MALPYEQLATGRQASLLQRDVEKHGDLLSQSLSGRSVAVIGAAGSIGSAVVRSLLAFKPMALVLIDLNENALVELVRDLRSSGDVSLPARFAAMPIGLGSPECARYFADSTPFDFVFNLSAVKHVRSEKDVYSLMRMVDTNVLFLDDLLSSLPPGDTKVFSVSTDKAAGPVSLMGASKRVMEMVLGLHAERVSFSSARFANVAFSEGSLLQSFERRIRKRQPIAAPTDVRRFFISHQEAGELCLLAGVLGRNRETFFPKLEAGVNEKTFPEIAGALLEAHGYQPHPCASDEEAKARTEELIAAKKWPCVFAPSDTAGEKEYEEFFGADDDIDWERFAAVAVIRRAAADKDSEAARSFLTFARAARRGTPSKADYVRAFSAAVPEFQHLEAEKSLDDKL